MSLLPAAYPDLAPSTDLQLALRFVADAAPGDGVVEAARAQISELVRSAEESVLRTHRPGHLTGSALVVDAAGEHLALMFHAKLQRWLQPGGHADGDTNLAAVALREATEETGIEGLRSNPAPLDLDVHEVRPPKEDPHLHLDVRFLVVAPHGARLIANHESTDLRWVAWSDLGSFDPDSSLVRLAAAAHARLASC